MKLQMTVGKRVGLLAVALVACCMAVGISALAGFLSIDKTMLKLTTDAMPGLEASGDLATTVSRFRGNAWKMLGSGDARQAASTASRMDELGRSIDKQMSDYEVTIHLADDRANFDELRQDLQRYLGSWHNDVLPLINQSKREEAVSTYLKSADPLFRKLDEDLTKIVKWNADYGKSAAAEAIDTVASTRMVTLVLEGGSFLVSGLLSVLVLRGLRRVLRRTMSQLNDSSAQVASAAAQVAASSQSSAQGSSEQAASLEETSAAAQQIATMATQNTESSRSAADLVLQSQQKFVETNQSLEQMVEAMNQIKNSSDKISKIIKVIDEIAFQTNILALNAAVEAARAGEAGMGFAVVADEVRNLAQRSAQAARDTAGLIEESIARSNDGALKVDRVAAALGAITEESTKVKTFVDEVNLGSQEQARGIDQIGQAITQIGQVTQANAASAEESASAAQELSAQSEALKRIVQNLSALVGSGSEPDAGSQSRPTWSPSEAERVVA